MKKKLCGNQSLTRFTAESFVKIMQNVAFVSTQH